jgi:HPt (histidine-containing phosphotransfer) domain-containing protein
LLEKTPDESSLPSFTTQVHALKSALANIGADGLSRTAALLEKAGREADLPLIRDKLPSFREELAVLMERIRESAAAARVGDAETLADPEIGEALARLREALEAKDIDGIDAALARLQALPLAEKTREVVSEIADSILTADLQQATDILIALLDQGQVR